MSACNTAAGDGRGNASGLSGQARGFLTAGSRAVVVTHWSIPSAATLSLNVEWFASKADGGSGDWADALRVATRKIVEVQGPPSFVHPANWGAFATFLGHLSGSRATWVLRQKPAICLTMGLRLAANEGPLFEPLVAPYAARGGVRKVSASGPEADIESFRAHDVWPLGWAPVLCKIAVPPNIWRADISNYVYAGLPGPTAREALNSSPHALQIGGGYVLMS